MFESGVLASWVTLPTGEVLVGETLRRVVGSPTGPDTVAVLLALADLVRSEEERGLLADGWAKVAAWAAAQATDLGVALAVTRPGLSPAVPASSVDAASGDGVAATAAVDGTLWSSPRTVEACAMRSAHAREATEVRR